MKFVFFALLISFASAGQVRFEDCGHHEVTKLDISQCADGASTCVIHKGKELKLDAEILANQDSAKIEVHLTANIDGLSIPIPGVDKDGCKYVTCPIKKGEKVHFNYSLVVPKLIPNLHNVEVGAKITGDHGLLACLRLKGDIAN